MADEPQRTAPPAKPPRRMDARSLRGLAHPLRMQIFELLSLDGPATATGLSERLGENTGTVSWHLRHLAEHGFIEEEAGRGTKRERWWRRAGGANELHTADFRDDPDSRGALSVYLHELVHQYFGRVTTYLNEDWDGSWRDAGTVSDWRDLRMTPDQLAALNAELMAVIARHTPAPDTEPSPDALPVVVQLQSFPRKRRGIA
ncbi:ArsR/SmtB family transcription factor [Streptomyces telluris]|uniref:Helix-turn-helix domain-containing protein n=1 Tax=Streptomyces telluris TaxID=2720021 RepID=A0A9X2RMQ3_9ACTN|nr:helix-turn-helix domain-containing protein [Streptomyces telluris]MCQ8771014.1 helix-turn-helix domain-containing protein [Streptomyces telluris]NJP79996.1 helix-turn-helix domain-containing protein [Streptomyces telluris]